MLKLNRSGTTKVGYVLILTVLALFAASCANPLSADADSQSTEEAFCDSVADTESLLETTFAATPNQDVIKQVNQNIREVKNLLPDNAPSDSNEYLSTLIELTDNGGVKLLETQDEDSQKKLQEQQDSFWSYVETNCTQSGTNPSNQGATDSLAGDQTNQAGSTTLLEDGPTGNYESVIIDIGQVHSTTSDPASFLSNNPEEPTDQAHVLVEVQLEATADQTNQFSAPDFKLQLPDGTTVAATSLLDTNGKSATLTLNGKDSASAVAAFETDTTLLSLTDVSVGIEREEHVPLYLTLEGTSEPTYPISLETGQTAQVAGKHVLDKCETLFDATVQSATVELETFADTTRQGRVDRNTRFVVISLEMKNITNVVGETVSDRQTCGFYSGQLVETNIRLQVDERPISTETATFRWPQIEVGSADVIELVYTIPVESQTVTLVGHNDEDVVATWDLTLPSVPGE